MVEIPTELDVAEMHGGEIGIWVLKQVVDGT